MEQIKVRLRFDHIEELKAFVFALHKIEHLINAEIMETLDLNLETQEFLNR